MTANHPDYASLAAKTAVSNLHKHTKDSFSETVKIMYNHFNHRSGKKAPLIANDVYEIIIENATRLDNERWFTHASPTLFNAGTPWAKGGKNQKVIALLVLAMKGWNLPVSADEEKTSNIPDCEQYKSDFPEEYTDAKFFVIKCYSKDDIQKSIKYDVWASTQNDNKKLDGAYQKAQQKHGGCPIFLLFFVNTSGKSVGLAEIIGPVDFNKILEYWQQDKWDGGSSSTNNHFSNSVLDHPVFIPAYLRNVVRNASRPSSTANLSRVVDEADCLFGMGFAEQLHQILAQLGDHHQTLLFSATLHSALAEFAKAGLREPLLVRPDLETKISPDLKLVFFTLRQEENSLFQQEDIEPSECYGDMNQDARKMHVSRFKSWNILLLIVTDIVVRGIDIPLHDTVINWNFWHKPKIFIHLVGRVARADRVLACDLHSGQSMGYFDIPLDHVHCQPVILDYLASKTISSNDLVVVPPDVGGVARARTFAKKLSNAPLAIVDKRRHGHNVAEVMNLIGDVKGKVAVMVDDMIDTAGTIAKGATLLHEEGAREVYACFTHGVFSPPAIERLSSGLFQEVIITNTIPVSEKNYFPQLTILTVANLLAVYNALSEDGKKEFEKSYGKAVQFFTMFRKSKVPCMIKLIFQVLNFVLQIISDNFSFKQWDPGTISLFSY
ncbi:uncharacterized protein LOC131596852 [Vicia villosa]|uniref:uncharacterized protein LOC131596852 n=1 Tax=Vicia villosa TaxID=3911 RepID=UPI00273B4D5B|nr:uncharacterized protein LOC131596852 [Vicia villosa]